MEKQFRIKAIAAAIGFGAWVLCAIIGMRAEAWDSPLYFPIAVPGMMIAAGVMGAWFPVAGWRMGGWMALGHGLAVLLTGLIGGSGFGLFPLTVIVLVIISAPLIGAAAIGGAVGKKIKKL